MIMYNIALLIINIIFSIINFDCLKFNLERNYTAGIVISGFALFYTTLTALMNLFALIQ